MLNKTTTKKQAFICANIILIPKSAKGVLTCSDKYRSIAIRSVMEGF